MTATDVAWAVLQAAKIETADNAAVQTQDQGLQSSLRKHKGKSVEVDCDGFPCSVETISKRLVKIESFHIVHGAF